jgi:cytoskeletal protein RodZ
MTKGNQVSVGTALTEARIRAGLSLDDVSERTRIRRTLVDNIEHDDYHSCGGLFYARGHIKSIAHTVMIDPAPLLAEFDRENQDPDVPTASGVLDTEAAGAAERRAGGHRPNWSLLMVIVLAGLLGLGVFHLVTAGSGSTTGGTSAASSNRGSTGSTGGASSAPSVSSSATPPGDAIAELPAHGVTVQLTTSAGRSWVSATGKAGAVLYQNVLGGGQEQTVRDDHQVKLVLGNAGAVHLVVNGRDLGSPGGQGQVVRLTFGPGDPTSAGG